MASIFHHFQINAPVSAVFNAISTPDGLRIWWSENASGIPFRGETYKLTFGADHNWTSVVSKCKPDEAFELTIKEASEDWINTRLGFSLSPTGSNTSVRFYHEGWKEANEHYRISCYCWAMYLRILKRYLEHGEQVPYKERLEA